MPQTLAEKVWERHVVHRADGEPDLLYVDLHLVHEVTSPQAFESLRLQGRTVRRPDLTVATMDHNVPTTDGPVTDEVSARQMQALQSNADEFGVTLYPWGAAGQGIVHVIGPELGYTQPGMTIVCGDSHTSTHGAFGALAFGIGTSEVEHVLATQTLPQHPAKTMAVTVDGELPAGVGAKDVILAIINRIGTSGGVGHVIEYRGSAIRSLSMEGRMTICNMSIEGGARAGMVAPDDTTFAYVEGRPHAPTGADWEAALDEWRALPSDPGASFDTRGRDRRRTTQAVRELGHEPRAVRDDRRRGARPRHVRGAVEARRRRAGARVHEPRAGHARSVTSVPTRSSSGRARTPASRTFGSRQTSSRGRAVAPNLRALVVPGSVAVKMQAEREGLDRVFSEAGFEWRGAGCSMCLGMNPDILTPGERSASTSNRNFEGRQGKGGRTHLVSPAVAAATAVLGRFGTPDELPAAEVV